MLVTLDGENTPVPLLSPGDVPLSDVFFIR